MKKEVTILKTWKWEELTIDISYEDFLIMERDLKQKWEDWFNSSKYRRFIKFAAIEDKIGKTQHILLEAPKEKKIQKFCHMSSTDKKKLQSENPDLYYKLEKEDEVIRIKARKLAKEVLEKGKERRIKKFIEDRKILLNNLEKREIELWLESTKKRLLELEKFKKEQLKNNNTVW